MRYRLQTLLRDRSINKLKKIGIRALRAIAHSIVCNAVFITISSGFAYAGMI
jgi:hypothetical protein